MKKILFAALLVTSSFASINNITSFEADFLQKITDDKGVKITYEGHVMVSKPIFALWKYTKPIKKSVYIIPYKIIVIEPEIEQAIIKQIGEDFNFFEILENAKKIDKDTYLAKFKNKEYILKVKGSEIESISYKDELENSVVIKFKNQKENKAIPLEAYKPHIPQDYDLVRE